MARKWTLHELPKVVPLNVAGCGKKAANGIKHLDIIVNALLQRRNIGTGLSAELGLDAGLFLFSHEMKRSEGQNDSEAECQRHRGEPQQE